MPIAHWAMTPDQFAWLQNNISQQVEAYQSATALALSGLQYVVELQEIPPEVDLVNSFANHYTSMEANEALANWTNVVSTLNGHIVLRGTTAQAGDTLSDRLNRWLWCQGTTVSQNYSDISAQVGYTIDPCLVSPRDGMLCTVASPYYSTTPSGCTDITPGPRITSVTSNGTCPLSVTGPCAGYLGGTQVTITGEGFDVDVDGVGPDTAAVVYFDTIPATSIISVTSTQIVCIAPPHSIGVANVIVTNPNDQYALAMNGIMFVNLAAAAGCPVVSTITPSTGPAAGGTLVNIYGSNFGLASQMSVTFDGTLGTSLTTIDSTHMTVLTPAHAAGAVTVVVTNTVTLLSSAVPSGFTYS